MTASAELPPAPPSPTPLHPRDAEIELTERVAQRLVKWTGLFAKFMVIPLSTLYAALVVIGWSSWNDFKKSIDDFNQNVKPLIQQAKHDAQDASDAARSAKNQIKETTDEANRQLEAVKKSNGTIEELQRELKQLIE